MLRAPPSPKRLLINRKVSASSLTELGKKSLKMLIWWAKRWFWKNEIVESNHDEPSSDDFGFKGVLALEPSEEWSFLSVTPPTKMASAKSSGSLDLSAFFKKKASLVLDTTGFRGLSDWKSTSKEERLRTDPNDDSTLSLCSLNNREELLLPNAWALK